LMTSSLPVPSFLWNWHCLFDSSQGCMPLMTKCRRECLSSLVFSCISWFLSLLILLLVDIFWVREEWLDWLIHRQRPSRQRQESSIKELFSEPKATVCMCDSEDLWEFVSLAWLDRHVCRLWWWRTRTTALLLFSLQVRTEMTPD
jgi:hypothetical protein